jgi:glycosyltransferase involved in cell wall biosynthesis
MNAPIAILYLITSTNVGGTEKVLLELIRHIDRKAFKVYVCSVKKPGSFAKALADEADGFFSLKLSEGGGVAAIGTFIPAVFRLIKLIRALSPSILHCFLFRANILGRIAGRIARVPVIISSIRVIEAPRAKHLIDRMTAPLTTHYLAVSQAARNHTINHAKISPSKIVTIYNGITCKGRYTEKPNWRSTLSLSSSDVLLGLIGRFHKQKGHIVLLKALPLILAQAPHTHALFCGEGREEARLKVMAQDLGLEGHVHFVGLIENAYQMLSQIDIVVVPSLWEGMPNVVLEAMAAGRPVVASRIAGMDEVVVAGETGLLCNPGDPHALADAILKLIKDTSLMKQMGRAGYELVRQRFQISTMVEQTVQHYQKLLKEAAKTSTTR